MAASSPSPSVPVSSSQSWNHDVFLSFREDVRKNFVDHLYLALDQNIGQWRSALDRLKEIPDKDIIGKLRISFDGLEPVEKDLFLDIACFFRWKDTNEAIKLLDACAFHSVIGVEVLRQKALIVINEYGKFDMHDLVQEMGHYIVRGEHPKNPEKHNRVWNREDVKRILAMDATTVMVNLTERNQARMVWKNCKKKSFQVFRNKSKCDEG